MRLGQLARKLSIRPSAIVDYLAEQHIASDEGTNTKLSEETTRAIILHFNPSLLTAITEPSTADTPSTTVTIQDDVIHEEVVESSSIEDTPVKEELIDERIENPTAAEEEHPLANVDIIKAPKVSLAGLKVLGKIDLPEPKKKDLEEATVEPTSDVIPSKKPIEKNTRERKQLKFQGDRKRRNSTHNPIALQREKEAREAEEKRREQIKREKEIRTQRYHQRVKPTVPTKPARIYDEPLLQLKDHQQKTEPTSWWGRFWRWYTS
jgi:hypothetical protein